MAARKKAKAKAPKYVPDVDGLEETVGNLEGSLEQLAEEIEAARRVLTEMREQIEQARDDADSNVGTEG